jgi:MFS family permease
LNSEHIMVGMFLAGSGMSLIGNVMAMVALPWFVLQTTGSAAQTGLTGMAAALPAFISGLMGGPLVDRLGGRRMSVISDLISAVAILAIPVLYQTVGLEFWQLLVLVFLGALLDIPGITARRTLLPEFSRRAQVRPEAMNSSFEMLNAVSGILGPALAGLLIAPMGAVNLLWLTGAGFLVSAAAVYGVAPEAEVTHDADALRLTYRQQLVEGLTFIRADKVLLSIAVLFALSNLMSNGFFSVGLPVLVHERFGDASRLGLLFTVDSIGLLIGGVLYGAMGHRFRGHRRLTMLFGFMAQPVLMLAFVWESPFPLMLLGSFLIGLFFGPVNPLSVTVRFERIPVALRGRVFSTFSAITAVVAPLGMAATGYMIEAFGLTVAMGAIVGLYIIVALCVPRISAFREMDVREPAVAVAGQP